MAALKAEEERKTALTRELEAVGAVEKAASLDCDQIKRDLRARVADVQGLLARHTPQAGFGRARDQFSRTRFA